MNYHLFMATVNMITFSRYFFLVILRLYFMCKIKIKINVFLYVLINEQCSGQHPQLGEKELVQILAGSFLCMFSSCMRGFALGTPTPTVQKYASQFNWSFEIVLECECECVAPQWTGKLSRVSPAFTHQQLGQAPATM